MGDGGSPPTARLVSKLVGGSPETDATSGTALHLLSGVAAGELAVARRRAGDADRAAVGVYSFRACARAPTDRVAVYYAARI
jgi:hypothetical protein